MGQNLCCFRPPSSSTENQKQNHVPRNRKPKEKKSSDESGMMTLEDYLIRSPALPADQIIPVLKQPKKRVYPSSSDSEFTPFYTPRMSFSTGNSLEKISEGNEEADDKVEVVDNNTMKKKVHFKLPHEADMIIYYSPQRTFDSITDHA